MAIPALRDDGLAVLTVTILTMAILTMAILTMAIPALRDDGLAVLVRDQVAALALEREVETAHLPARGVPLDERHAHRLGALGERGHRPLLVPLRQWALPAGCLLGGEVRVELARHQGVA